MTTEQMAEMIAAHLTDGDELSGCALRCGYDGDDRATHLAEALAAEGFGHVPTALRCTATMIEGRSNQFFDTMQRMVGEADTDPDDILRYGSYGSEAQSVAYIIRDRADEKEGMRAYAG